MFSMRNILALTAVLIAPIASISGALAISSLAFGFPLDGMRGPLLIVQCLEYILSPVSLAVLCLWAAHNFKPLKFFTPKRLINLCIFGIFTSLMGATLILVESILSRNVYGVTPLTVLSSSAYVMSSWCIIIAQIVLLIFAIRQIRRMPDGQNLSRMNFEEIFE